MLDLKEHCYYLFCASLGIIFAIVFWYSCMYFEHRSTLTTNLPKYQAGDCVALIEDDKEEWEINNKPIIYKILQVGKKNYKTCMFCYLSTDGTLFPNTTIYTKTFDVIDNVKIYTKVKCNE